MLKARFFQGSWLHTFNAGERVYWSECPAHCESLSPFEIMSSNGDEAKLDLFPKPVALVELEKCDR